MTLSFNKNYVTAFGVLVCLMFVIFGYQQGIFASPESLKAFLDSLGVFAPLWFISFQIIQCVVPIIPGGFGCVIGVVVFGPFYGFIYNYISISIGSTINFLLAKRYGKSFILKIISEETYNKYEHWLYQGKKVEWMFGMAILFPCAPDDIICLLAGLTPMSFNKFLAIMVLGKPASLLGYSIGLPVVMNFISSLI